MRNEESDECLYIIGELPEKITEHPHTQAQTVDSINSTQTLDKYYIGFIYIQAQF